MSNNRIDKWAEVERLAVLPKLRDLLLHGNPIADKGRDDGNWRIEVLKRLPLLKARAPFHTPRAPPFLLVPRAHEPLGHAARAACALPAPQYRPNLTRVQTLDGELVDDAEREEARQCS